MANKKISAFTTVTDGQGSKPDVRNLSAIAGVEGADNAKISGTELVSSVINSNNSGAAVVVPHRVTFYNANGESLAGSENLSWDNTSSTMTVSNTAGGPLAGRLDLTHETISQTNDSGLTITSDASITVRNGLGAVNSFHIPNANTGQDGFQMYYESFGGGKHYITGSAGNNGYIRFSQQNGELEMGDSNRVSLASTAGSDLELKVGSNTDDLRVYLGTNGPSIGDVLAVGGLDGNVGLMEWSTPSSGGIDFSGLNIATIKADLTQATQTQYGTAITVTAGANIANGDIVIWDYSNGTVRSIPPSSLPAQNQIIGVAIENINSGSTGKILIYGYATVKSNYSASNQFLNETNTINIANSTGVTTTLPTTTGDYLTFEESSTGNNISSSSIFDAGAGNTVRMEIVDFDFEGGTGTPFDRMQILVGPTQGSLSNATLTPGITGSTGAAANNGWRIYPNFFTSSTDTNGPLANGNAFPQDPGVTSGGQTGPDVGDQFDLGQRYAQFDFKSDGSGSSSFELRISSSQAVAITDTTPGAGIYLDGTNFEQGTNNISTNRFIGTAAGGSFADNAMVILVAPPRV